MKKTISFTVFSLLLTTNISNAQMEMRGGPPMQNKGPRGNMLAVMDSNEDQVVTEEEFLDHQKEMFSEIDENNDGEINIQEMMTHKMNKRKQMKEMRKNGDIPPNRPPTSITGNDDMKDFHEQIENMRNNDSE